jgi:hypothetical protein
MEARKGERKCTCGEIIKATPTKWGNAYNCLKCGKRAYKDGFFADKELRDLRIQVHDCFDTWWKKNEISRKKAYIHITNALRIKESKAHMRYMDKEQCNSVIVIYKNLNR